MKSMFTSTIQVSLRPFGVYIDPRSILMGARLRLLKYWGMSCSPQAGSRPKRKNCLHLITIATVFVLASSMLGQTTGTGDTSVTAVRGESWLLHSRRSFGETNMGKTWNLGPPPPDPGMELPPWQLNLSPGFPAPIVTLHGSDLYRMTCQGCHKESRDGRRGSGRLPSRPSRRE